MVVRSELLRQGSRPVKCPALNQHKGDCIVIHRLRIRPLPVLREISTSVPLLLVTVSIPVLAGIALRDAAQLRRADLRQMQHHWMFPAVLRHDAGPAALLAMPPAQGYGSEVVVAGEAAYGQRSR